MDSQKVMVAAASPKKRQGQNLGPPENEQYHKRVRCGKMYPVKEKERSDTKWHKEIGYPKKW